MQTDKNNMKVEKSVSKHSHAFERPYKCEIVTDTKSRNASHMQYLLFILVMNISGRMLIVNVMSRPSLLLYTTFINTFSSIKNIFSKDKKDIVWKVIFTYYFIS